MGLELHKRAFGMMQEDGRPVRYDAPLLWVHIAPLASSEKWVLLMLARNPLDPPASWVLSYEGHSWRPIAVFESPPRNREVYGFIVGHWEFEPDSTKRKGTKLIDGHWYPVETAGFRILAGAVRVRTWRNVIGETPTRFHRGETPNGN